MRQRRWVQKAHDFGNKIDSPGLKGSKDMEVDNVKLQKFVSSSPLVTV